MRDTDVLPATESRHGTYTAPTLETFRYVRRSICTTLQEVELFSAALKIKSVSNNCQTKHLKMGMDSYTTAHVLFKT
jgi:hypothetical protein